jgi:hypothetical protein
LAAGLNVAGCESRRLLGNDDRDDIVDIASPQIAA